MNGVARAQNAKKPFEFSLIGACCASAAVIAMSGMAFMIPAQAAAPINANQNLYTSSSETAPRFISAYEYHCYQEMANEDISGAEADWVVENYYLSAVYQDAADGARWRYDGPGLTIVLNLNGFCMTAFRTKL